MSIRRIRSVTGVPIKFAGLGEDLEAPVEAAAPLYWHELDPYPQAPALPEACRSLAELVRAPAALSRRLLQIGVVDLRTEQSHRIDEVALPVWEEYGHRVEKVGLEGITAMPVAR